MTNTSLENVSIHNDIDGPADPFNVREYLADPSNYMWEGSTVRKPMQLIRGHHISIQRSKYTMCDLRVQSAKEGITEYVPITVELGFPTYECELLAPYAVDPDNLMDTTYNYVPIEVVQKSIDRLIVWLLEDDVIN